MSHTSVGVISKPVDNYGDIAAVLGRNTGDEGQLCGDVDAQGVPQNKINFWSLHRPICLNRGDELTEADWKSANYGYTINNYNKPVGDAGTGLIYAHLHSETWLYLKPRGVAYGEPFRKLDFNGYNHSAANPFSVEYNSTPEINGSSRIDITFLDDFLEWGLFEGFAPRFENLHLGLLAWPASSANPQSCFLLPVTSGRSRTILEVAGDERFTYTVPSNVFSSGTQYVLRPVIMTYDAGNNYGVWRTVSAQESSLGTFWDVLCPEILVTPASAPPSPSGEITVDGVDVDTDNAVFSGDDDVITIESVPITIHNTTPYQMTNCALYVYFKDYQQANPTIRELGHTSSFSISANSSSTKTVTGNLSIRTMASGIANGYWTFIYTTDGRTHTIGGDTERDGGRFSLNINK